VSAPRVTRRLLYLAYYYPPIGGAGVQNTVKFLKYLPQCGVDSTVVTGPALDTRWWSPHDDGLARDLPVDLTVARVPGPEPDPAPILARLERWLPVQEPWRRWWVSGAIAAAREAPPADAVVASMSPYASAQAATAIARERGIPWVALLRDPWALDEMMEFGHRFEREQEMRRMRRSLATAAAIVMNTPEAAARLRATFPELAPRVHVVTNGFDRDDFAGPPPARDRDIFQIVHTGYLHSAEQSKPGAFRAWLRRGLPVVDRGTRSHVYLANAVEVLLARRPDVRGRLELVLAGQLSAADAAINARYGFVRSVGYQAHEDAVTLMRGADLLFLPMQNLPARVRATIVPGKTYEYLASGRPILAAIPEGDARDILLDAGTTTIVAPDDVAGMAAALEDSFDAWAAGYEPSMPPASLLARLERRALAGRLAEVISGVT
jgi:glycosyltransferase involved in cell wall biosynthesis